MSAKLQQFFNINKLNFKFMKTIYQIVVKGTATNRILLFNYEFFNHYLKDLERFSKDEGFVIITTNQYYI